LANQFIPYYLCDENHEWWVEARVQLLLEAVENNPYPRKNETICHTEINKSLKLRKTCRIDGIPNE
jgi:hypothetical protein